MKRGPGRPRNPIPTVKLTVRITPKADAQLRREADQGKDLGKVLSGILEARIAQIVIESIWGYLLAKKPGQPADAGYSFGPSLAEAWTFSSEKAAAAKCGVLEKHFSAGSGQKSQGMFRVETKPKQNP
jgi:hypothetical protein